MRSVALRRLTSTSSPSLSACARAARFAIPLPSSSGSSGSLRRFSSLASSSRRNSRTSVRRSPARAPSRRNFSRRSARSTSPRSGATSCLLASLARARSAVRSRRVVSRLRSSASGSPKVSVAAARRRRRRCRWRTSLASSSTSSRAFPTASSTRR